MEELMRNILIRLSTKLPSDQLNVIAEEIRVCLYDYDITKKCTDIVPYVGLPYEYKAFVVSKQIEGRSEGTLEQYRMCLESMFNFINKSVADIKTEDIRIYLYQLQKNRGLSDRTLKQKRSIINSFFGWCVNEGILNRDPSRAIKPIKCEIKPVEPLNDIEMEKLRRACKNIREQAIVEVLYSSGCRCAELSNLKISDIDLVNRKVNLFGKGKKHRQSKINARAVVLIKEYLKIRNDTSPYLIVRARKPHTQIKNGGIEAIIKTIGQRAGIYNMHPHRLRHTFATECLRKGMGLHEVQWLMGHASPETTEIYIKSDFNQISYNYYKCIS